MIVGYESNFSNFRSGIESYSCEMLKNISLAGPDDTFALYCCRSLFEKTRDTFSDYNNIHVKPTLPERKGLFNNLVFQAKRRKLFRDRISRETDLFHFFDSFRFVAPFGVNIVTFHDLFPITVVPWDNQQKPIKRLEKKFASSIINSESIIANSLFTKQSIIDYYGIDESKIEVVYLAASPVYSSGQPDYEQLGKAGISQGDKYFLFVGRLDKRKNIAGMLEAYSLIGRHLINEYKFVIVADSGRESELKSFNLLLDKLDIRSRVIHLRKVPESLIANLYRAAFGLVFASYAEGFGIPILEAMQSGCPVITSNTSSMPEVAGDCAIYTDPYNILSIKEAMIKLIDSPGYRDELITKGLGRSREFSYIKTAGQTYRHYQKVLNSR